MTRIELIRSVFLICPAAFLAVTVQPSECAADELGDAVRSAAGQVAPSVVRIRSVGTPDRAGRISSCVTTGVVVSSDGEVVTSSFGFGDGVAAVFVETAAGERHSAKIVAQDHVRRLVLLQTDAPELLPPEWTQEDPSVGAWAVAAGRFYPASMPSASLGVISAVNRVHGLALQTDAKVSPVNYGGPLFTLDGRVVGVLVPLAPGDGANGISAGVEWYDSGIGFAIPARDVLRTVEWLRRGNDRRHGVLGVGLTTQNPLATEVRVQVVHPGSPADLSGIRKGDQIVAVNGRPIERVGILQGVLKGAGAGDSVDLVIRRGEDELQMTAVLAEQLSVPERGWLGIVPVAQVIIDDESVKGVQAGILEGSPLATAGLPSPCVITAIGDSTVATLPQLRSALAEVSAGTAWTITFREAVDVQGTQTVSVTAEPWPGNSELLAEQVLTFQTSALPENTLPAWRQSVTDLDDDTHVWVFGPESSLGDSEFGVVVVFSDGEPVKDHFLRDWREVCRDQRLVLAVVYRDYAIPLTAPEMIGQAMAGISKFGAIDPDRLVLVTPESHAAFVTRLLLNPRLRPIHRAVFLDCRPSAATLSLEIVRRKQLSIMIFASSEKSESRALLESLARSLTDAGARVTIQRSEGELLPGAPAAEIARWLLLQKIR